jgi:nucleotide-binding universal stress UspA family protein
VVSDPEQAAVSASIRYGEGGVPTSPTILVPIRYPLTARSTRTLEHASQLADDCDAKQLIALHIDLLQHGQVTTPEEIHEAIAPAIPDQSVSVYVTRSFLLEKAILEEAETINADVIVLGKSRKVPWRRVLDRIVGTGPDVVPFLSKYTTAEIVVVE